MSFNMSKVFVSYQRLLSVEARESPYRLPGQKAMILFPMISVINASLVAFSSLKQELIQLQQSKSQAANLHHKNSGLTNVYHPLARIDSEDLCQPQSLHIRHIRINSCRPSSQYKRA